MQGTGTPAEVRQVRRSPRVTWIAGFAALLALLAAGAAPFVSSGGALALLAATSGLGIFTTIVAIRRNLWGNLAVAALVAGENGATIDEASLRPADFRKGVVIPRPGARPWVRLERRGLGSPVEIEVADDAAGRQLLRSLGLDASQAVASFLLPAPDTGRYRADGRLLGFAFAAPIISVGASLFLPFRALWPVRYFLVSILFASAPLLAGMYLRWLVDRAPLRVAIGADGIVIRRHFKSRFIPMGDIERVTAYDEGWRGSRGVEIELDDGEKVRLSTRSVLGDGDAVLRRLLDAFETHRTGNAIDAPELARGDRTMTAWVTSLRSVGAGANVDARTAPVAAERLWRVVEDPASPPLLRAASAVALTSELDESGRSRLRDLAKATAAPRLRFALEKAAETTEADALAAALADVEAASAGLPVPASRKCA